MKIRILTPRLSERISESSFNLTSILRVIIFVSSRLNKPSEIILYTRPKAYKNRPPKIKFYLLGNFSHLKIGCKKSSLTRNMEPNLTKFNTDRKKSKIKWSWKSENLEIHYNVRTIKYKLKHLKLIWSEVFHGKFWLFHVKEKES